MADLFWLTLIVKTVLFIRRVRSRMLFDDIAHREVVSATKSANEYCLNHAIENGGSVYKVSVEYTLTHRRSWFSFCDVLRSFFTVLTD